MRKILWLFIVVGLLAALYSASQRWRTEWYNRSVEITLDWAQVRDAASASGVTPDAALDTFRAAGVTSIALTEDTVASLEESHRMTVAAVPTGGGVTLDFADPADAARVEEAVQAKAHLTLQRIPSLSSNVRLSADVPYSGVRGVGLGLDPYLVKTVQRHNLGVVGRVNNFNGVRPDSLRWTLQRLKDDRVSTVIFSGDEMLGYKAYLTKNTDHPEAATTKSVLEELDMNVGIVEFGKQKGDGDLAKAAQDQAIRVHTVPGSEMVNASIPSTIQRFLLGARERNIRLLYVRLFLDEPDPVTDNAKKFIKPIADNLGDRGSLEAGLAHPYKTLTTPIYLRGAIGLGIAASWLLLVESITGVFAGWAGRASRLASLVGWGGAVLLVLLSVVPMLIGAKLAALAAACILPSLALLYTDLLAPAHDRSAVTTALRRFVNACAITSVGIVYIVGMLADRLFLIKADAFLGIKPAQMLPLLLITLVYVFDLRGRADRSFATAIEDAQRRVTDWAREPIRWWHVGALVLVLAVVFFLLARSGNDPGVGVSELELKFRALLDRLLYVRPRSKEFGLGHPALVLALIFASTLR